MRLTALAASKPVPLGRLPALGSAHDTAQHTQNPRTSAFVRGRLLRGHIAEKVAVAEQFHSKPNKKNQTHFWFFETGFLRPVPPIFSLFTLGDHGVSALNAQISGFRVACGQ